MVQIGLMVGGEGVHEGLVNELYLSSRFIVTP
jgi:hypothetical protein